MTLTLVKVWYFKNHSFKNFHLWRAILITISLIFSCQKPWKWEKLRQKNLKNTPKKAKKYWKPWNCREKFGRHPGLSCWLVSSSTFCSYVMNNFTADLGQSTYPQKGIQKPIKYLSISSQQDKLIWDYKVTKCILLRFY